MHGGKRRSKHKDTKNTEKSWITYPDVELPLDEELDLSSIDAVHLEHLVAQFVPLLLRLLVVEGAQRDRHLAHEVRRLQVVVVLHDSHEGQRVVAGAREDVLRVPHRVEGFAHERGLLLVETDDFQAHLGI